MVSDNTALHTAIQRAQRALQVAEGHQLTTGARKVQTKEWLEIHMFIVRSNHILVNNFVVSVRYNFTFKLVCFHGVCVCGLK